MRSHSYDFLPNDRPSEPWDLVDEDSVARTSDRFSPGTAGALAGLLGGLLVAAALWLCDPALVSLATDRWLAKLSLAQPVARAVAGAALVLASVVVGALFASVTRRLRRFSHAAIWSVVFFSSLWIGAGALIAKRAAHLAAVLPFGPLLGVTAAYALSLALHVPFRRRD